MASASDIAQVRRQVNEPNDDGGYTDVVLGEYVDANGVTGATVLIWEEKASKFSDLVDVTEAGSSHKFSDLSKIAGERATYYRAVLATEQAPTAGRVRVRKIVRS